ncbi:MAG TPA: phosphatase PAP2 family protein [Thermoanaerobaculia bacterium]|jgi:undecaprenyl-diphosphatase|nr:phosphatase PAP2 family protein [Thermoanaerobaculia bacterium]
MTAPPPTARRFAPEHRALALALLVVAGVWLFAALAFAVLHGDSRALDEAALRALRDPSAPDHLRGPAWLLSAARDITALGSHAVLVPVLLAAAGFLLLLRKQAMALAMLGSGGGAMLLENVLKRLFARPRPVLVPQLVHVGNASFPSGHALLSSAVYLSIAVLVARLVPYRRVRLYVLALAAALVILIGFTRVLFGVHYPTDVIGGWIVGGLWALTCGVTVRALQHRGAVEPAGLPPEVTDDASPPAAPRANRASRA